MNWPNLRKSLCPFCNSKLLADADRSRCCQCSFEIDNVRMEDIARRRGGADRPIKQMRWQNLHEKGCPVCGFELSEVVKYDTPWYVCTHRNCEFRIRINTVENMKGDPKSAMNQYKFKLDI